jgi:hypothetical protein
VGAEVTAIEEDEDKVEEEVEEVVEEVVPVEADN